LIETAFRNCSVDKSFGIIISTGSCLAQLGQSKKLV